MNNQSTTQQPDNKKELTSMSIVLKSNPFLYKNASVNLQKNIKKLIKDNNLKTREFAELTGLSYSYMQNTLMKKTDINPTLEVLMRISIVFGISLNDLVK